MNPKPWNPLMLRALKSLNPVIRSHAYSILAGLRGPDFLDRARYKHSYTKSIRAWLFQEDGPRMNGHHAKVSEEVLDRDLLLTLIRMAKADLSRVKTDGRKHFLNHAISALVSIKELEGW